MVVTNRIIVVVNGETVLNFPISFDTEGTIDGQKYNCWTLYKLLFRSIPVALAEAGVKFDSEQESNLHDVIEGLEDKKVENMYRSAWKTTGDIVVYINLDKGVVGIYAFGDTDMPCDEPDDEPDDEFDNEDTDDCDEEKGLAINIERVIFNGGCTIIKLENGMKSIARCDDEDEFSPVAGFAVAMCKLMFGNRQFHDMIKRYCYPEYIKRKGNDTEEE